MSFSRIEMEMMNSIIDMGRSMREIATNMGKIMQIRGKRLPLISTFGADAELLDVWRMDDGVAFTISERVGEHEKTIAGCQIKYEQWRAMVAKVESQFGNRVMVEKDDGK